jgi:hypothetical protein
MFEQMKYQWDLRKLLRDKKRFRDAYDKDIRRARKEGKSSQDIQQLKHEASFEIRIVEERISMESG